jgi:hypothetical protein
MTAATLARPEARYVVALRDGGSLWGRDASIEDPTKGAEVAS